MKFTACMTCVYIDKRLPFNMIHQLETIKDIYVERYFASRKAQPIYVHGVNVIINTIDVIPIVDSSQWILPTMLTETVVGPVRKLFLENFFFNFSLVVCNTWGALSSACSLVEFISGIIRYI